MGWRIALGFGLLGLAACGRTPAHDVAYYTAHPHERSGRVVDCGDNPARRGLPDCMAALSADGKAESQRATPYVRPKSRLNATGAL